MFNLFEINFVNKTQLILVFFTLNLICCFLCKEQNLCVEKRRLTLTIKYSKYDYVRVYKSTHKKRKIIIKTEVILES